MNPNARKRLNAMTRYDRDAHLRAERKFTKDAARSDKTRLFTAKSSNKESDNMQRINHADFMTYTAGTIRIRVPHLRFYAPRICTADGHTITITRKRAARFIRQMRTDNKGSVTTKNSVGALQRKSRSTRLTRLPVNCTRNAARKAISPSTVSDKNPVVDLPTGPMTCSPAGDAPTNEQASRLWQAWMRTQQRLTFQQYMDRWIADNTASN